MKRLVILLCILLTFILSSCGYLESKGLFLEKDPEPDELTESELNSIGDTVISNAIQIDEPFYSWIVDGKLQYTVTKAEVLNSIDYSDIPLENFDPDVEITVDGVAVTYPDFLDLEGNFIDGCQFILITLDIENINATAKSVENPYRFRADSLYLCNLQSAVGTADELQFPYKNICYFSLRNSTQMSPFAFDLYPGEEVQVQIGFLIDDGWNQLNKLMLSTISGSYSTSDNRGAFVKLDLDAEEG